jgi:hypothetical protein
VVVATPEWRTVEFIAKLLEADVHVLLDSFRTLGRNNLVAVSLSHTESIEEEAIGACILAEHE